MTQQDRDDALDALARAVDGRPLSTAEIAALREILHGDGAGTLREVIRAYQAWRTLGKAARFVIVALGMLAATIAAADVVAAKVRSWLGG